MNGQENLWTTPFAYSNLVSALYSKALSDCRDLSLESSCNSTILSKWTKIECN